MIPIDTQTLTLRDGRTLAYTEHGDPDGFPVVFLHGNPGSRYMRHPNESIAEALHVRIITPDRPGFGYSDFHPHRQLLDYPCDIRDLMDSLSIEQFVIFGVSAGGPYVAACAFAMPDRIIRAAIVSGAAPLNRRYALAGVNTAYQAVFRASIQLPYALLKQVVDAQLQMALHKPHKLWVQRMHLASKADRRVLEDLNINDEIDHYYEESARQGARGIAWESKLLAADWRFDLKRIRQPLALWYWDDDTIVPPQMGHYIEEHVARPIPHFLGGGGHFAIFDFWGEIIRELVNA